MSRLDVIVWEVVGETFWLVALVVALIFGLITYAHPSTPRHAQPDSGAVMQVLPEAVIETWFPSV
jgi:hypothetical protein